MRVKQYLIKILELNSKPQLRSRIHASESTQLVRQGCFFFHFSLPTLTTNWAQIFTGLLFYEYVEIHQVRRLVFDNYQTCLVLLITDSDINTPVRIQQISPLSLTPVCVVSLVLLTSSSPCEGLRGGAPSRVIKDSSPFCKMDGSTHSVPDENKNVKSAYLPDIRQGSNFTMISVSGQ